MNVSEVLNAWGTEPRASAQRLMEQYGEPDEISKSMLIWRDTPDGWKRTELSDEPTLHKFPAEHNDFLKQVIDYKVPIGMFSTLAAFDGSIGADRTRGEMSARCGGTSMNLVAINLAHDIITGRRSVDLARREYTRVYKAYQDGERPEYTQSFQFEFPFGDTKDPDVVTLNGD